MCPFSWNNIPLSVRSATSVATFIRGLKTYLFDSAFRRRHRCALLPVDVTERLQWLHIWTPIWLLRYWAWLRWGYWRYRNLIDWLIMLQWWFHNFQLTTSNKVETVIFRQPIEGRPHMCNMCLLTCGTIILNCGLKTEAVFNIAVLFCLDSLALLVECHYTVYWSSCTSYLGVQLLRNADFLLLQRRPTDKT